MRVLRPGGALAFTTIELAPDLTPLQRERAEVAAPPAAASDRGYLELLDAAGFVEIGSRDVSGEFRMTAQAWLDHSEPVRDRLEEVEGAAEVAEKLHGWREKIEAVEEGLVRRTLYWGRRAD